MHLVFLIVLTEHNNNFKVITNRILAFLGGCIVALLKAVAIESFKEDACYEQMELYNGNKFTEHFFNKITRLCHLIRKVFIMPG